MKNSFSLADELLFADDYGTRDENFNPKEGPLRKAGVRSPILVDPVYQVGEYSGRTPRPAPRVKPEAEDIASKSKGTVSKLFVTEEKRYSDYYNKPSKNNVLMHSVRQLISF